MDSHRLSMSMINSRQSTTNGGHGIYKVTVRDREFRLSFDQIMADEPNIFTAAFLQDFSESKSLELSFDRSPELFALIVDHLSGYRILPLAPAALPPSMSTEAALENLAADALFYGLERLLDALTLPPVPRGVASKYDVVECVRLTDVASGRLGNRFVWTDEGFIHKPPGIPTSPTRPPGSNTTVTNGHSSRPPGSGFGGIPAVRRPVKHVMVFAQDVMFKIDLTCRANGDCHEALFAIELPLNLSGLRTKPLHFREESQDWVATPAESLFTTPLTLDGFKGNLSDLAVWAGSFLKSSEHVPPPRHRFVLPPPPPSDPAAAAASSHAGCHPASSLALLDQILPGLASELSKMGARGETVVKMSAHLWANELSLLIGPHRPGARGGSGSGGGGAMVAKVLNCKLETGLEKRRRASPVCRLSAENGWQPV